MIMHWECPRCRAAYKENAWTIRGERIRPSRWKRSVAWLMRRPIEPAFRLWHTCPQGHRYDKGAPYAGLAAGPTRALLPDGTPVTLSTLLALHRPGGRRTTGA